MAMIKIEGDFKASPIGLGKFWYIREELTFYVRGKKVVLPENFLTDFASTQMPRLLLPICATFHDWGYWEQKYPRKEYDLMFLELMTFFRINPVIKWMAYAFVRSPFGIVAWYINKWKKERGVSRIYERKYK